jgi:predicted P-loop ATPase/primase-polymerase (primpol)-like protein
MSGGIVAHFNPSRIPDYLKQRIQWIVWGKRTKQYKDELREDGKLCRIPFEPRTGEVAKHNDPSTWGTFDDAILAYQSAWYNGIGFMLAENDGLVGIILNQCFIAGTKTLLPEAEQILAHFDTTFAEISLSGDAVQLYCFGLAFQCGKSEAAPWLELYGKDITGQRTNRYFCVTGNQISKTLDITDCQASLAWLHETFKAPATSTRISSVPPTTIPNNKASCLEISSVPTSTISNDRASRLEISSVPTSTISNDRASRLEKYVFKAFDEEVLKVQQATKPNAQLFKSASALNEFCNSAWAAPFITKEEVETALLNATTLPYKEAQRIIANAFKTATGTREEPTSTVFEKSTSQQPYNLNSSQPDINWQTKLARQKIENNISSSLQNIALVLEHDKQWLGILGYNEFTRKTVKLKHPPYRLSELGEWQDTDDINTAIWLEAHYGLKPSTQKVSDVIKLIAQHHKFHPVREYLTSLKWDGKSRVNNWLSVYLGVLDTKYARLVGKTWLISAIARIMTPGCKVDNVLILEGEQGSYKSTALRLLCQNDAWFNDTPFDLGSKDAFMALTGKWIIELAELDSFNKADSARAKAFFSSAIDTYREPYGRNTVSVPRQCVFAGSVNKETYLKDETGNRRYLPVECTNIDLVGIKADRDQLWAEAYQMYKNGEHWWTNANDPTLKKQQEARFEADVWEDIIVKYLEGIPPLPSEAMNTDNPDKKPPRRLPKDEVTMTQLLQEALQISVDKQDRRAQTRVGNILKKLGWKREQRRIQGGREYIYTRRRGEK